MNISPIFELNSKAIKPITGATTFKGSETENVFESLLNSAVNNINTTNGYLSTAENEEIKLAMGETDNTHDLAIALQKASTALQYTVAIKNKFLEAYKELMNMQI